MGLTPSPNMIWHLSLQKEPEQAESAEGTETLLCMGFSAAGLELAVKSVSKI